MNRNLFYDEKKPAKIIVDWKIANNNHKRRAKHS